MASVSTESGVQFAPYSSAVDAAFWHRLTQNKVEIYQLDDKPQPLQGYYVNSEYGSIREWVIKHIILVKLNKRISLWILKLRLIDYNLR